MACFADLFAPTYNCITYFYFHFPCSCGRPTMEVDYLQEELVGQTVTLTYGVCPRLTCGRGTGAPGVG